MKRILGIWMTVWLMVLHFMVPVFAASEEEAAIEAVSGYCLGDKIYAFIQMNESYDVGSFKVNLQSDAVASKDAAVLVPITESGAIVRYVFMVDLSSSMRKHTNEVNAFVETVITQEQQEAFYTVATFGEHFEIAGENLTDRNTVIKVLDNLKYTEQMTDPYTGVESALTYLYGCSRGSGDVIHLVLITDGVPDFDYEGGVKENEFAQSAAEKIKKTPEIIVSTFCTAEWEQAAYETFSTGTGIHEQASGDQEARAAGEKMADYADSLYCMSFQLSKSPAAERFYIELQMRGSNHDGQPALFNTILEYVPNLKMFSNGNGNDANTETVTEGIKESENADTSAETEYTEEAKGENTEEMVQNETEKSKGWCIILAVAVIIAAGICVIVLTGKRKKEKTKSAKDGVAMKLDVYSGICLSKTSVFYLTDSLIIGSDKRCDIVFGNEDVSPQNSRIFMKEQMIYIEDIHSKEGTALGGMRIQGQNRLRSGDVISIGTVEFSLKF